METIYVIQGRYPPGTALAEVLGSNWEDEAIGVSGVTRERAKAVLVRTQEAFLKREWRLVER